MAHGRSKNRKQYELHKHLYKPGFKSSKCYYCNDPADTTDHVPSLREVYIRGVDFFESKRILFLTIPSCGVCNSALGDKGWTPDQRAAMLYEYYSKKYTKILNQPHWDDEELEELGPNLRSAVDTSKIVHDWIERKLQYMEDIFQDVL